MKPKLPFPWQMTPEVSDKYNNERASHESKVKELEKLGRKLFGKRFYGVNEDHLDTIYVRISDEQHIFDAIERLSKFYAVKSITHWKTVKSLYQPRADVIKITFRQKKNVPKKFTFTVKGYSAIKEEALDLMVELSQPLEGSWLEVVQKNLK